MKPEYAICLNAFIKMEPEAFATCCEQNAPEGVDPQAFGKEIIAALSEAGATEDSSMEDM